MKTIHLFKNLLVICLLLCTSAVFGQVIVDPSGNAGVGTATPTEKLDVDGDVKIRNLEGTGLRTVLADSTGKLVINTELGSASFANINIPFFGCEMDTITISGLPSSVPSAGISVTCGASGSTVPPQYPQIGLIAPNGQNLLFYSGGGDTYQFGFGNVTFCDSGDPAYGGILKSGGSYQPGGSLGVNCNGFTSDISNFADFGGGTINPNGDWVIYAIGNQANQSVYSISINFSSAISEGPYNYISKYSKDGSDASVIYQSNCEQIGIGTISPEFALDILTPTPNAPAYDLDGLRVSNNSGDKMTFITREADPYPDTHLKIENSVSSIDIGLDPATFFGTAENYLRYNGAPFNFIRGTNNVMTLTTSGDVGIGTTSPVFGLHYIGDGVGDIAEFYNSNTGTNADVLRLKINQATPTLLQYYVRCVDGVGATDGGVRADGAGGVNFATTSDRRLKTNIVDFKGALEILDKVQARQYEFKARPGTKKYGFVAQELQEVYPMAVVGSPDSEIEEPMMIDYSLLTPLLAAAVKEQQAQIEELEEEVAKSKNYDAEIEALQKENEELRNTINALVEQMAKLDSSIKK
ncbi:MAG: hypothetical protein HKN75_01140 [Bacteroidia bacterium]|nr:hypothetical protein [Bacteroidia bacterium]